MQVFVPFKGVRKSLRYLARKPNRLFAQLREGTHVLLAMRGRPVVRHQDKHVVTRAWQNNERFLRYYLCRCSEAIKRYTARVKDGKPYDTTVHDERIRNELGGWITERPAASELPEWWNRSEVHESYRAMLYRKNPELYPEWKRYADKYDDYVYPVPRLSRRKGK